MGIFSDQELAEQIRVEQSVFQNEIVGSDLNRRCVVVPVDSAGRVVPSTVRLRRERVGGVIAAARYLRSKGRRLFGSESGVEKVVRRQIFKHCANRLTWRSGKVKGGGMIRYRGVGFFRRVVVAFKFLCFGARSGLVDIDRGGALIVSVECEFGPERPKPKSVSPNPVHPGHAFSEWNLGPAVPPECYRSQKQAAGGPRET